MTCQVIVRLATLSLPCRRDLSRQRHQQRLHCATRVESHPQPSFQGFSSRRSATPEPFALITKPRATPGCALKSSGRHIAKSIPERPDVSHACHHLGLSDCQIAAFPVRPAVQGERALVSQRIQSDRHGQSAHLPKPYKSRSVLHLRQRIFAGSMTLAHWEVACS
jgi:hypothetical protein